MKNFVETRSPTDEDCVEHFNVVAPKWAAHYDQKWAFRDRNALFARSLQDSLTTKGLVMDFGCGTGQIAIAAATMGHQVLAIDGSAAMLDAARTHAETQKIDTIDFQQGNAEELDLAENNFDAIICSSVLEYVDDDAALIRKFSRALRPNSALIISVPHALSIFGKVEDLLGKMRLWNRGTSDSEHWYAKRRYQRKLFRSLLADSDLEWSSSTYFELPIGGRIGVLASRSPLFGLMELVVARKRGGRKIQP